MDKRELLKLLAAAGIGTAAGTALSGDGGPMLPGTSQRLERILASNTIRAGYIVYPPFFSKDPNTGALSGLCYDVVTELAKNLALNIDWVEESFFGTAPAALDADRFDLAVGNFWPNAKRARVADFVAPMFYSGMHVLVRTDDSHYVGISDYSTFDNATYMFTTIDGDISALVIQQMFPQARVLTMPIGTDYAQLLENVSTGKADIALIETTTANRYIKSNPGKVRNLTTTKPFQVFANCFMIKKGEESLKAMLSTSMEELLNSGMMDRILEKYQASGIELYRVANPYQT